MNDITVEKRLELIQDIRREHENNCLNLKRREKLLYGKACFDPAVQSEHDMTGTSQRGHSLSGIRILLSVILFSLYVILDYSDTELLQTDPAAIYGYITENYDLNVIDFIGKITYTLKDV